MISRTETGLELSGNITMDNVSELFKEGLKFYGKAESNRNFVVDFSRLEKVDSSAVSLMLSWLRSTQNNNVKLQFANVPPNLMSLAKLYGVAELLSSNLM